MTQSENEAPSQLHNVNQAPHFVEPHVHPDVDSYLREKLEQATAKKTHYDKLQARGARKHNIALDDTWQLNYIAELREKGEINAADELLALWALNPSTMPKRSPDAEVKWVEGLWTAAARGNFTDLNTEIAQDITRITNEIANRRQSTEPGIQADVEKHDSLVAELAVWQRGLQETPVNSNTILGKQINKTVVNVIQQRDNTDMGSFNKQLKHAQSAQKAIVTLAQPLQVGK
jgi:hypothetical protein